MSISKTIIVMTAVVGLAACGGSGSDLSTPDPVITVAPVSSDADIVRNADNTISGTSNGQPFELPETGTIVNGQPAWIGGALLVNGFETDDVLAIGGVSAGEPIAAIAGNLADAPAGDATFTGRYAVYSVGVSVNGPLTVTYDLATSTVSASDGEFEMSGAIASDGAGTGTITFAGATADWNGGVYSGDSVAGVFTSCLLYTSPSPRDS